MKNKEIKYPRWAALTFDCDIIAEGDDAKTVVEKARKLGKEFILEWISDPKINYIF